MVPLPTPPAWLLACVVCSDLHELYRSHLTAGRQAATLTVQEELARHLVADHLDQVPGYVPDCSACGEWRAVAADASDAARLVAAEDLRHRAMHLFAPSVPTS
ncbi:hypothetical protein [Actinomadura montaniterrae]|uniref:Uncharacterized protein n=1 Tax=Actinomadura montaniterrae TaxID=1803903 RepID=A0A6L3VSM8_9ACTN|nr:hypothetical protein [Actinomadura montaniterrae]KAB2376991.1 hypothetical protein F9B16_24465 [Actinomadura montaniterrae]